METMDPVRHIGIAHSGHSAIRADARPGDVYKMQKREKYVGGMYSVPGKELS